MYVDKTITLLKCNVVSSVFVPNLAHPNACGTSQRCVTLDELQLKEKNNGKQRNIEKQ